MAKFGSIEWQDEMINKIESKMIKGVELEAFEKVFLDIQYEHDSKIMEGI